MLRNRIVSGRFWLSALFVAVLILSANEFEVHAQSTQAEAFYYRFDEKIPVTIERDRLIIIPHEGVGPQRIVSLLAKIAPELKVEPGPAAPALTAYLPAPTNVTKLAALARDLRERSDKLIDNVGFPVRHPGEDVPMVVTDEFVARFKEGADKEKIAALHGDNAVKVLGENPYMANQFLLGITPESGSSALEVANRYQESGLTSFAHPNFLTFETPFETIPNDALFGNQWHHRNTGQSGGLVDADADVATAWDFTTGAAGTLIAVFDDGLDMAHEDLAPNLFSNPGETPGNGIDDDGNGYVDDINGWDFGTCGAVAVAGCGDNNPAAGASDNHGTAVAGVAAARGNNMLGVSGSCPNCSILPLRRTYGGFSEQAKALAFGYAQAMGADIMNNSWGHTSPAGTVSAVTTTAINNAAAAGMTIMFAASNGNSAGWCNNSYPSLASVLAVSSTSNQDRKVVQAAFGNCVDVLAPSHRGYSAADPYTGTLNITTTDRTGNAGYNNTSPVANCPQAEPAPPPANARSYTNCFGGTSSATPLTAGVGGLVLSANPGLGITRAQLQNLLQDTTDRVEPSVAAYADQIGFSSPASGVATHAWGRINAAEAVQVVAPTAAGGHAGVDIFLRDNRLDWGNTDQPSNTTFESPRGYLGHWKSVDIKVDAPPLLSSPPATSAAFEAFVHEKPKTGLVNKVYVRVRNRGPVTAAEVAVKLHWAFAGTGLPPLPADFWSAFPSDSSDTTIWHPLGVQPITELAYSGASAAGCPGRPAPACGGMTDQAQIVSFDFLGPPVDPMLPNHFCLMAIVDSPQDPVDPDSMTKLVVDEITPLDNNVTHRNIQVDDSSEDDSFVQRFFVRNPWKEAIQTIVRLRAPKGWKLTLEGVRADAPFSLKGGEERLATLKIQAPRRGAVGTVEVTQERLDPTRIFGGLTYEIRPIAEDLPKPPAEHPAELMLLRSLEDLLRRQAGLLDKLGSLIQGIHESKAVPPDRIVELIEGYDASIKAQAVMVREFGHMTEDYRSRANH